MRSPRTHPRRWGAVRAAAGVALVALAAALGGCTQATPPTVTLLATSGTLSVAPGATSSLALQVTPEQGFTGSLALHLVDAQGHAVTGLAVTPGSLTVSGSDPMLAGVTVAAAPATALGDYQLRLELSGNGVSASVPLDVSVQAAPPPDFSLAIAPTAFTATPGGKVSATVVVASQNGFAGTVALTVANATGGVASGVTLDPGTVQVAAGQSTLASVSLDVASSLAVGSYDLALLGTGAGAQHEQWLTLAVRLGTLGSHVEYAAGSGPEGVALGDLNGDGNLDAVTADYVGNTMTVLLGQGDGSFQTQPSNPSGTNPDGVALADLNGDGNLDVVTGDAGGDVWVSLGNGDGTFAAAVGYPAGTQPVYVAVGDVNGDGVPDIVAGDLSITPAASVLLGHGDGTFQAPTAVPLPDSVNGLVLTDLNGDGNLDVVVPTGITNTGQLTVLLGDGAGGFGPALTSAPDVSSRLLAIADFNGDGIPDAALEGYDPSFNPAVSILLGAGDGTFHSAGDFPVPANAAASIAADVNGDGNVDVVTVMNANPGIVSVLAGNGDGTLRPAVTYDAGASALALAAGDLNNDGRLDVVTANVLYPNGTVSVLLGR